MVDRYDAGQMNDYGGGDVDWWWDYLRAEIDRANDFHADIHEQNDAALAAKDAEIESLKAAVGEWKPISTCPIREPVDLWCVYGGEEFAQYDGGSSIGQLVSNRFKTYEYGFFGNQSNDGVPQANSPDLVPVAWRTAVLPCPASLIADVLGIPLTREDAIKEPSDAP